MKASNFLLLLVTIAYALIALAALFENDRGKALMFAGYVIANIAILAFY